MKLKGALSADWQVLLDDLDLHDAIHLFGGVLDFTLWAAPDGTSKPSVRVATVDN